MPAVRSFARKISFSRSLYLQLLFVTLTFALMIISSGIFVNHMLVDYLKRDAVNILMQTQIRIMDELLEPETLMIPIVKDVHDIIIHGGNAEDVLGYYNEISADLLKKEEGFIFDGLHGYFEALGDVYIPALGWAVPDDYIATERPWYKAAVKAAGKIVITPIYMSLRSGEYQINVACRIFNDEGEPLGVVTMNVLLHNITQFVADMHLVEGGYGFLANENFDLVAHHEAGLVTKHMSEIGPASRQIMETMEKGENFAKVDGYNYQGIRSIFYCDRIENGWYLGIITPRNVYYKDLRILMSFLGVLGFVLMLAVNVLLIRIGVRKSKLDEVFRKQRGQLNKRLEQQSLMTYISQSFLSDKDMDALITEALRMVGEFMDIDQILMLVTEDNGISYTCRNAWLNPKFKLSSRIGVTFSVAKPVVDIVQKVKEREYFYVTSNDPDVREAVAPYRSDFYNYLLVFIFLGDKLHAIIDFSLMEEDIQWDQEKINMAAYMANILSSALNKRTAEFQLIAAKEAAEQSNRSKGVFLAHMSHEIRTPMNAILGISEIQLRNKTISPDAEEAFKQIYDSGNLLLNIINDILDLSKVEAGKLEIVPVIYNIPSLINDAVQLNRLRYESKPIEFIINVDENTPLKLYGDELRIKQILNNLLSNAFKYTDKGKIELSAYAEHGEKETVTLILKVSDTGQGMKADQIDRLFDEYSRFNMQTNRNISGVGLGMNIVKRLIDMMGGQISVESAVGIGTTFTVRLPQESVGSAVCGTELAESLRDFSFYSMSISKKAQIVCEYMPYGSVLIVDDVASNLYVAKGLLTPYGLRIETAASGIEAVEKIKNGGVYDIVFMDHMMPIMDGMEAVKIIRGMGYTRPVIALTANAVIGQSEVFLANGFDGFISKPIDSRELDASLKIFIRDKQPREVIEATRREQHERETEVTAAAAEKAKEISEISKYFILDGENAIKVIEEVYTKLPASDAKAVDSYIIAVHGMKNVLANIGETELSGAAYKLEQAGKARDFAVITEETPAFLDALRFLIGKLKPSGGDETTEISDGDAVYLREKLLEIKTACEKFDIEAAKNALGDLQRKAWPRNVNETLDEISVHLLHSAFKKAAAVVENTVT
ncbi:MAG: response regulator [Treponema sp.]|jgi:signal transduction histidine kinase/CheY-like chemotaxis protein|nr:response regulator [Treponema sp.]